MSNIAADRLIYTHTTHPHHSTLFLQTCPYPINRLLLVCFTIVVVVCLLIGIEETGGNAVFPVVYFINTTNMCRIVRSAFLCEQALFRKIPVSDYYILMPVYQYVLHDKLPALPFIIHRISFA